MVQSKNATSSFPLKSFLFLVGAAFAIAATLLIILLTSAATVTGGTPFSAVTLAEGANTGILTPGEQRWYKYNPDPFGNPVDLEKSLTLIFTPDNGNRRHNLHLQLFEEGQLQNYFQGDASTMTNFGAGHVVERDGNPVTGENFWHGWLEGNKTYYVLVENGTDVAIDYWLFTEDIIHYELGGEAAPEAKPPAALGADPSNPAPLAPGLTQGKLAPHTTYWYAFTYADFNSKDDFQDLSYSMYFTPDDGNRRHHINFELFPMREYKIWQRGDADKLTNFGAGSIEDRDNDNNTASRVWRGQVENGMTYLMAVSNNSDVEVDYWIYDDDIFSPQLGEKPAPAPAPDYKLGAAPDTAVPLKFGVNIGHLEPDQEVFYRFQITDNDNEGFEPMALTMITTPDDGHRIYRMNMDIFTAHGVQNWSPGDNSQISNVGAGGVVFRDDNPVTGEKFWNGWVVDNDVYYVQLRNLNKVPMDYWLFTGDVYRPELGPPTKPTTITAAPGTAPIAPIPLEVGTNQGQLNPGEERWYTLVRADVAPGQGIDTVFTMVFTPDDGNRKHQVGLEFFEQDQVRDWAPDNPAGVTSFGEASVVDRDGDPNTGEKVWKGRVLGYDQYFMRVINGSDVVIDYWIFPDDVINANLE